MRIVLIVENIATAKHLGKLLESQSALSTSQNAGRSKSEKKYCWIEG